MFFAFIFLVMRFMYLVNPVKRVAQDKPSGAATLALYSFLCADFGLRRAPPHL